MEELFESYIGICKNGSVEQLKEFDQLHNVKILDNELFKSKNKSGIYFAAENRNWAIVKYLMDCGISIDHYLEKYGQKYVNPRNSANSETGESRVLVEAERLKCMKDELQWVSEKDLTFVRRVGSGVFGMAILCKIRGRGENFVCKINLMFPPKAVETERQATQMEKEQLTKRDFLEIPFHTNIVAVYKLITNAKIDLKSIKELPGSSKIYKNMLRKNFFEVWNEDHIILPIVIMKFYPHTLEQLLENRKKLGHNEVCFILSEIIDGASHLNENKIVHLDLEISNIFLSWDIYGGHYRFVIGDFGHALDLRRNETGLLVHKERREKINLGDDSTYFKPDKLAPEISKYMRFKDNSVLENEEYLDFKKCDLYSIGRIGVMLLNIHKKESVVDERLTDFVSKLLLENPKERIGFSDAKMEIRELLGRNTTSPFNRKIRESRPVKKKHNESHDMRIMKEMYPQITDYYGELREILRGKKFKHYTPIRSLGMGAFGLVLLSKVEGLGDQEFAIKISKKEVEYSQDETKNNDFLKIGYHKNVVTVLGLMRRIMIDRKRIQSLPGVTPRYSLNLLGRDEYESNVLVMEPYRTEVGHDLEAFIKAKKDNKEAVSLLEFVVIMGGTILGATHLHKNNIVHFDLHPGNIYIDNSDKSCKPFKVLIGDFGGAVDVRENISLFQVKKNDWRRFCLFSSPFSTREIDGVIREHLPPEITRYFNYGDESVLVNGCFDCEKVDLYGIGLIGKVLVELLDNVHTEFKQEMNDFFDRFLECKKDRINFDDAMKDFFTKALDKARIDVDTDSLDYLLNNSKEFGSSFEELIQDLKKKNSRPQFQVALFMYLYTVQKRKLNRKFYDFDLPEPLKKSTQTMETFDKKRIIRKMKALEKDSLLEEILHQKWSFDEKCAHFLFVIENTKFFGSHEILAVEFTKELNEYMKKEHEKEEYDMFTKCLHLGLLKLCETGKEVIVKKLLKTQEFDFKMRQRMRELVIETSMAEYYMNPERKILLKYLLVNVWGLPNEEEKRKKMDTNLIDILLRMVIKNRHVEFLFLLIEHRFVKPSIYTIKYAVEHGQHLIIRLMLNREVWRNLIIANFESLKMMATRHETALRLLENLSSTLHLERKDT